MIRRTKARFSEVGEILVGGTGATVEQFLICQYSIEGFARIQVTRPENGKNRSIREVTFCAVEDPSRTIIVVEFTVVQAQKGKRRGHLFQAQGFLEDLDGFGRFTLIVKRHSQIVQ